MANYNTYIELSPDYESVVDIDSEKRHPNMWQEYIVHEDMRDALDVICQSLSYEDNDKRRSFWIHGAYGTGKSYAAIVLKHLFEDPISSIRPFLSKQMLVPYRDAFIAQREKGEYLVVWKKQTTDIKTSTQLMMSMELSIVDALKKKYGDQAYLGRKSLVTAAKNAVADKSYNWQDLYDNSTVGIKDTYEDLDDFIENVNAGNLKACNMVSKLFRDKGWGFFTVLDDFKDWIKDIIEGNHLSETGIVFIWDEFTTYLRDNPTDDVLQPISEYCKTQPFFMCLIVHNDSSVVKDIGEDSYERICGRYHTLSFHVSESAAHELIADSILTRTGMETQWDSLRKQLMDPIEKKIAIFDELEMSNKKEKLRKLCPLHPMTLSLLTIVAHNFGASQRTLFRFMKDREEARQNVGFIYYINNFGPDNWKWLTIDFLWDYFFARESDVKEFSAEAKAAYQHYVNKKDFISDDDHMHVFKAALLLIAVMSSGNVSNLYSRTTQRKVAATRSTLHRCFIGVRTEEDINGYLNDLVEIGLLRLDENSNGDYRLQIPYQGGVGDVFQIRKDLLKSKNTRYDLFRKGGVFAKRMEAKLWDKTDEAYNRVFVAACTSETNSITTRLGEVTAELQKNPYRFGILAIAIDEKEKFTSMQIKIKELAACDTTGRLAVCLLKEPLTDGQLDRWYSEMTHKELASEEGKDGDSTMHSDAADEIVSEWVEGAGDAQLVAVYKDQVFPNLYGAYDLMSEMKKNIIFGKIFTAAPELLVETGTAFKKMQNTTALAGIQRNAPNTQVGNIKNGLENAGILDVDSLSELTQHRENDGAAAVATLATMLSERFSQGTRIKLDELWSELQQPPYGYYNCMACGYILGFVLRFYVNSEFSWNRGDNNPWPLTEQTLATMVDSLCKNDVVNHYLSPGSEVWQKFKPYAQRVFKLSNEEAVNDTEARKYMSKQCTEKAGVPFWVLKYVPAEKYGGEGMKAVADEIIDLFCDFMAENGNQETVMSDIRTKFTGHRPVRDALTDLYFNHSEAYQAFSTFITSKSRELQELRTKIGLTNQDLFDAIHQLMQGQVSTWTEQQVEDKLGELCIEYRAVAALNKALGTSRKSIKQLGDDMANVFSSMVVPGSVIEALGYDWISTLQAMRKISTTQWSKFSVEDRLAYTKLISDNAKTVWGNVTSAKNVLKKYMEQHNHSCTEEELESIYSSLATSRYDTATTDFDSKISTQLNKIAYIRNSARINELWHAQSGFATVDEWCNHWAVPVQWIVSDEAQNHIATLRTIQTGRSVNGQTLNNATQYFESHHILELKNAQKITDAFFAQVGETYRAPFAAAKDVLISRLKTNSNLTSTVYNWGTKVGAIRTTLDAYLRDKYCNDAKKNVRTMKESVLRDKVVALLDQNPDLYSLFID